MSLYSDSWVIHQLKLCDAIVQLMERNLPSSYTQYSAQPYFINISVV